MNREAQTFENLLSEMFAVKLKPSLRRLLTYKSYAHENNIKQLFRTDLFL